jgi:predicted RNA-binding Zn-ribbon protein involved in translation (DUF1610 family)
MAIEFKCSCGNDFIVAEKYAGKQGKCPKCGKILTVPQQSTVVNNSSKDIIYGKKQICPICKWPIASEEPQTVCPSCHIKYHSACWKENGGCGIYGCPQVPPTDHRTSLEVPPSYWGQENKPCPVCGTIILAAAIRCRHCGATFSSPSPENKDEYRQQKTLAQRFPQLRRGVILLFVFCVIPLTAPFAILFGGSWYISNRKDIKDMPVLYSAISRIAVFIAIGQTVFIIFIVMMFAAWRS